MMTITPEALRTSQRESRGSLRSLQSGAGLPALPPDCRRGENEKGRARMPPAALVDPATIDTSKVLVDREGIRRCNPQRFEMEQLTAILRIDVEEKIAIGYKDVEADEFWVRGHMPDYPLMPGVLICEAAAQLSGFFSKQIKLLEEGFIAFGGMEDVRFRGQVKIGDRLVLVCKALRLHRRHTIFECQGFVGTNLVFHGKIIGVPISQPGDTPETV
jgi:3-hydroxyacyl-[acyl-carrier-protein] dehydratase